MLSSDSQRRMQFSRLPFIISHCFYLCRNVISERFELACRSWSQIEGYSLLVRISVYFFVFHACILTINETLVFMILQIWPQILLTHFLKKTPIFSKSNCRRALGPTFLGSLHHFTSRAPHADRKKYFFKFFFNLIT